MQDASALGIIEHKVVREGVSVVTGITCITNIVWLSQLYNYNNHHIIITLIPQHFDLTLFISS